MQLKINKKYFVDSTRTLIQLLRSDWLRYIAHYQLLICRSCSSTTLRRFPEVLEEHLQRQQIINFRKRLKDVPGFLQYLEKLMGEGTGLKISKYIPQRILQQQLIFLLYVSIMFFHVWLVNASY